jgi:hypothetical protein
MYICVICVVLCVCYLYVIGTWVLDRFCVSAIALALRILSKDCVSTYDIKFSIVCMAGSMYSASIYMVIFVSYVHISTIKYNLCVTRLGYNVFR